MNPFCLDCPDHEACSTGWPCRKVKEVNKKEEKMNLTDAQKQEIREDVSHIVKEELGDVLEWLETPYSTRLAKTRRDHQIRVFQHVGENLQNSYRRLGVVVSEFLKGFKGL